VCWAVDVLGLHALRTHRHLCRRWGMCMCRSLLLCPPTSRQGQSAIDVSSQLKAGL
jgi:hypothetical protein